MGKSCIYGCQKTVVGRGMCRTHYQRWWVSNGSSRKNAEPIVRDDTMSAGSRDAFMARVDASGRYGCWLWIGAIRPDGYGQLTWNGKKHQRAHRVSYQLHVGPLDGETVVRHSCDNPPCVNPEHLLPGTHADNVQDKFDRNRDWRGLRVRGERSARAKLTEADVREIYALAEVGQTKAAIAKRFDVSHKTVRNILNGSSWQWLRDGRVSPEMAETARSDLRRSAPEPVRPKRACSAGGCDRAHYGRGWCVMHYDRWRKHGDPNVFVKAFDDRAKDRRCSVDGCEQKHRARDYCSLHLQRWQKYGDPLQSRPARAG